MRLYTLLILFIPFIKGYSLSLKDSSEAKLKFGIVISSPIYGGDEYVGLHDYLTRNSNKYYNYGSLLNFSLGAYLRLKNSAFFQYQIGTRNYFIDDPKFIGHDKTIDAFLLYQDFSIGANFERGKMQIKSFFNISHVDKKFAYTKVSGLDSLNYIKPTYFIKPFGLAIGAGFWRTIVTSKKISMSIGCDLIIKFWRDFSYEPYRPSHSYPYGSLTPKKIRDPYPHNNYLQFNPGIQLSF